MPPKKHHRDWSWCDHIKSPDGITLEHRRLAAGLHPSNSPKPCPDPRKDRRQSTSKSPATGKRNANGKRALSVESSNTDTSVVVIGKKLDCQVKRCHGKPRCFNHMGMEKWWKDDAQENFLRPRMGEELRERNDNGPPGLRNYGATCYANAFLQVWFHNVSFRNGVFEAVHDRINPLFHLAKIFAAMRYTRRPVVDPGALIEALRLNKGAQQDAAEFSKLLMDLIEKQFKAQGGLLGGFVAEQFAGQLEYRTKCNRCGYTSSTTSPFMELEIPLRDGCSLEGQLRNMLTPELLDGDNKYRCPQCSSLQPATRSTHLQHLPPALHFALNRFEYTPSSDERKKSKALISYPRKLRLENVDYELRGVVVHEGPKATQGHFTAEVYDENDMEWYFCSDGEVCNLSERPKKKIKLDSDAPADQVSRDAYMLVYQRSGQPPPQRHAPELMRKDIERDNDVFTGTIAAQFDKSEMLSEAFNILVVEKEAVLSLIPGDDCVVPRACLAEWLASDYLNTKWVVPSSVKCHHGQYDPNASGLRLISRSALERLKALYDGEWDHLVSRHPRTKGAAFACLKWNYAVSKEEKAQANMAAETSSSEPNSSSTGSQASHASSKCGSDKENVPPAEESNGDATPGKDDTWSGSPCGENGALPDSSLPDVSDSALESSLPHPMSATSLSNPPATNGALNPLSPGPNGAPKAVPPNTSSSPPSSLTTTDGSPRDSAAKSKGEAVADNCKVNNDDDVQCLSPPPEFPELDICLECVREEYERRVSDTRQAELLQEFKRANGNSGPHLLPRAWLDAWSKNKLSPVVPPTDPEYSLYCEHGRPFPGDKQYDGVSEEAVLLLRSVLGEFPVFDENAERCGECSAAHEVCKTERAAWLAKVKIEERLFKNQRNQSHVFGSENYLLPRSFFEQWELYLKEPVERPTLQLDLCPHGLLDFDPGLDKAEYIDKNGWERLCQLYDYPQQEAITIKYDSQPPEGKRLPIRDVSLATCGPCRADRFSDWKEMWLPVAVGENTAPSNNDGTRRRAPPRGKRGKEAQILVTKRTSVMDIQLELYEMLKIPPFSQRLLLQGRELDRQETIGGIGVLMGDHFNLIEVVEIHDDDFEMLVEDEGFGGTALVGQKSCEQCTMFNDSGATECQMCGIPFDP